MSVTLNTATAINGTFSNGNLTAALTASGTDALGIATAGVSAGAKKYWETVLNGLTTDFGPSNAVLYAGGTRGNFPGVAVNGYLGGGDNYMLLGTGTGGSAGIQGNLVAFGPDGGYNIADGVVLGWIVDYDAGTWGVSINNGTYRSFSLPTNDGTIYPAWEIEGTASLSAAVTFRFTAASQTYAPPVGFSALDPGAAAASPLILPPTRRFFSVLAR